MKKILVVFGTRPEAIKMAPLVQELQKYPDEIDCRVAVTAQHREMLDQVLQLFQIRPHYDLNIMQAGQTLSGITVRALTGLEEIIRAEKPDLVLVHGDTTTTFAAALAAYYCQVAVGHVEAGLRTHNKYSPFPEELNRHLAGVIADWHYAPTALACRNLQAEGVAREKIFITGNTVIDALLATVRQNYVFAEDDLNKINYQSRKILLVTAHRRENLGPPMHSIFRALRALVREFADVEVVFPVHKNPAVRQAVQQELAGLPRVHLIEPLDYEPFVNLMQRCYLVLTDSGGLQEEAPALGKPVLVLRDTTERPEAVQAGTVQLVGTAERQVYRAAARLLSDPAAYRSMAEAVNPYGDGRASRRIVQAVRYALGLSGERPTEFAFLPLARP
ncbi:non-hydrolyzing UDP-N-acetylglucosamine 2-epimerase [Desulfurispora thermophila]|uniref:non-hydrolyzing UDP-N-acetylglucosamine 2-epimerase n=1 Tax=Desulfurispora thermophila TaxID=265470 RepID=UPI00037E11BA|nr:UDP-N-acetylglucosamine 2-epimerase (non-hydrolyzing) [Desulfurispora thermophila]